jgi:molybdenum cofactor cytidylyltransferase
MIIRTPHLRIRRANDGDIGFITALWNHPAIMAPVGYPNGLGITPETVRKKLSGHGDSLLDCILIVEREDTGIRIGQAKMQSPDETGGSTTDIKLLPEHQRKGFGSEIKRAIVTYLFENTACSYVEATPCLENTSSIRMQESVGAIRAGRGFFQPSGPLKTVGRPVHYWIYRVYRNPESHSDCRSRQFRYSAIVPAAGKSERMGLCKHLLPWPPHSADSGYCVVECAVQSLLNAGVDPVVVVVGYWRKDLCGRLSAWPVTIVDNPDYTLPMSSSIRAALPEIPLDSALLVLPGDHPSVQSETVRRLIERHEKNPGTIFIPEYNLKGGHPPLFPPEAVHDMRHGGLNGGLRSVMRNPTFQAVRISVSDPGICKNVDTPGDYTS